MKVFPLILITLLVSGCASSHSFVRYERNGPVNSEVWRNNKTKQCERRVYLDSLYFKTAVNCQENHQ